MTHSQNKDQPTDEQILNLIRSGNHTEQRLALTSLYWRWSSPMKQFFLSRGCLSKDCEDLLQEVVVRIWRGATTFNGTGTATSWMWSIARNCLHDYQRKSARHISEESFDLDNDQHNSGVTENYDNELDDCIASGIHRFAASYPERSHALELWSTGLEIHAIAEVIGRSYGATRQFLLECRKKMRPYLEPCFESLTP